MAVLERDRPERETRYLVAAGPTQEKIARLLGFGAEILEVALTGRGKIAALISCPAEHAEWNAERVFSVMLGGLVVYPSRDLARDELRRLVDVA